jgi:hypothetical protein
VGTPLKYKVVLGVLALAFVAVLFVFGQEPSDSPPRETCTSKGIDPEDRKEGACYEGDQRKVVVNPDHRLRLGTLDARLLGAKESAYLTGPSGRDHARGQFVTFDLAITNRTDAPVRVGENQVILLLGDTHGEDVEAEVGYEPRSFLARQVEIPPGGTATGSVTFDVSDAGIQVLARDGNLDIGNFGATSADYEPEGLFEEPELGVIRTYRKAMTG